jgi:hypothetical protein
LTLNMLLAIKIAESERNRAESYYAGFNHSLGRTA